MVWNKIMYIVIIGGSGIGESLVDIIRNQKRHHIVLIDKNLEICEKIVRKHDIIVINGDATKNDILEESEINKADVLVTTTNDDSTNLMVISLAKNLGIKQRFPFLLPLGYLKRALNYEPPCVPGWLLKESPFPSGRG